MNLDPTWTFSSRYRELAGENRLSRALGDAKGKPGFIDLTETNPTRVGLRFHFKPENTVLQTAGHDYSPEPLGTYRARQAVARYYHDRGLTEIAPEDILLTPSTSEAYAYLFKLFLNPGDGVALPRPGYPLLEWIARAESVRCRPFSLLREQDWRIDRQELEEAVACCGLLVLVHPNNPTGSMIAPSDWNAVVGQCRSQATPVVVDEVFFDYQFGEAGPAGPLVARELPVFILNGLSKTCALPQAKLSWLVATGPKDFRREALARLEAIADTFLNLATAPQRALPQLLAGRDAIHNQIRPRLRSNYTCLWKALQGSPASLVGEPAGWSTVVRLPRTVSAEDVALELLERHLIHLHPGYLFDFARDDHLVISLLLPQEDFQEGVARLTHGLGDLLSH